ncbi:MAG TPA: ribonuclease catalytic domain-containing protein, partial [Burkholderiales bacterium]
MNVLYEEEGAFKVGSVMADSGTSLQVEAPHGKRSKIKGAAVLLRFAGASLADFLERAQRVADELDPGFLWEVSSGAEELGFEDLARDYFGHGPTPEEAAGVLMRLHHSPMHFYKRGKGRYKPAPQDSLQAALASAERKRAQAALQAAYVEQLTQFKLPPEFAPCLPLLLYRPDRGSLEWKAMEEACAATRLSPARLMERCGALPSSHDYHFNRFLLEYFPEGTGFGDCGILAAPEGLAESGVAAFSIDDSATTEIDDAFSVAALPNGNFRVGVHIAAPALGIVPGSPLDRVAARRLSTVYMPGNKITMLPETAVHLFTLGEERVCPALSMYIEFTPGEFAVVASESRVERVRIAANLRHETLEEHFNEYTLEADELNHPFGRELRVLWDLANRLESRRGKSGEGVQPVDYNFRVVDERVTITERRRGSPIDKVVSELMILVNSEWGRQLAAAGVTAIYRSQGNGKVKMSTVPA